ncbi:MAG: DUF6029 family protein [Bacteroidia bacterium]|nr:DUF6029 family protein [Bacteroidia bacterium]MDW8159246.1 DUF6029 family protein [Bacteroidia bacterium]
MKYSLHFFLVIKLAIFFINATLWAQDTTSKEVGKVNGVIQIDAQSYFPDSTIETTPVPEKMLMNSFANFTYTLGNFTAGVRYEAYLPRPLLGVDPQYGAPGGKAGIALRWATYTYKNFSLTAGNFYEQFGSGLTLRAWWAPLLGYDNAMDGIRVAFNPYRGIYLKGVYGKQRLFWDVGPGTVRGADLEVDIAELWDTTYRSPTRINIGANFVSRYQAATGKIPQNVGAWATRLQISRGGFTFFAEYAYKINDPGEVNKQIYRPGQALYITSSYFGEGFGITLSAKRLDNMDFRSDRTQTGQNLQINFLPPLAKQHTYRLPTLYLYATQPLGEMGIQADVVFNLPEGSKLGGKYGTNININYARIHNIKRQWGVEQGYDSPFLAVSDSLYYQDLNIEVQKKWAPKFKTTFTYMRITYNKDVVLGLRGFGEINLHALILETAYKINTNHSLRSEIQWMPVSEKKGTERDITSGSWVMLLLEYTIAPHWFITVWDEMNYGNERTNKNLHYYSGMVGFIKDGFRISLGYGRQRAGINCVGGICRPIPSMNGFSLSISYTF